MLSSWYMVLYANVTSNIVNDIYNTEYSGQEKEKHFILFSYYN